jgi:hypothetical protein
MEEDKEQSTLERDFEDLEERWEEFEDSNFAEEPQPLEQRVTKTIELVKELCILTKHSGFIFKKFWASSSSSYHTPVSLTTTSSTQRSATSLSRISMSTEEDLLVKMEKRLRNLVAQLDEVQKASSSSSSSMTHLPEIDADWKSKKLQADIYRGQLLYLRSQSHNRDIKHLKRQGMKSGLGNTGKGVLTNSGVGEVEGRKDFRRQLLVLAGVALAEVISTHQDLLIDSHSPFSSSTSCSSCSSSSLLLSSSPTSTLSLSPLDDHRTMLTALRILGQVCLFSFPSLLFIFLASFGRFLPLLLFVLLLVVFSFLKRKLNLFFLKKSVF